MIALLESLEFFIFQFTLKFRDKVLFNGIENTTIQKQEISFHNFFVTWYLLYRIAQLLFAQTSR